MLYYSQHIRHTMAYIREYLRCILFYNNTHMTNNTTITCTLLLCTTAVYLANKDEINDYIAKKIKDKKDKREKNK